MVKFNANEVAPIEAGNPVWQTVQAWAEMNMERLRNEREKEAVDLRRLDQALGGIVAMKALLALPAEIKKEHLRDPVENDHFDIPPPT
jgi:hypothetical protein